MGVDKNFLIRPREAFAGVDHPVVKAIEADLRAALPTLDFELWTTELDHDDRILEVVSIICGYRYFGPRNPSTGWWPQIREILVWAVDRYETYVGPDYTEEGTPLTREYIRPCDILWNTQRASETGIVVEVLPL